jgi:hypothetical protein
MKKILIAGSLIFLFLLTLLSKKFVLFFQEAGTWLNKKVDPGYVPCGGPFPHPRWLCIASSITFLGGLWYLIYLEIKEAFIKDPRKIRDVNRNDL